MNQHRNGDRITKQLIVGTLCFVTVGIAGAYIVAVAQGKNVPELREAFSLCVVGLFGLLGRTSTEPAAPDKETPQVVKTEPGQPLQTVESDPTKGEE